MWCLVGEDYWVNHLSNLYKGKNLKTTLELRPEEIEQLKPHLSFQNIKKRFDR